MEEKREKLRKGKGEQVREANLRELKKKDRKAKIFKRNRNY